MIFWHGRGIPEARLSCHVAEKTCRINGIVPDGMKIERIIGMVMANLAGGYSFAPIQRL
jgi:hypothetical protein